jgi:hypothetical protein
LQHAHEAHDRAEDATFAAAEHTVGWWWFREDAAVAGSASEWTAWREGRVVEDDELAFCFEGGGGDEWSAGQDAGV